MVYRQNQNPERGVPYFLFQGKRYWTKYTGIFQALMPPCPYCGQKKEVFQSKDMEEWYTCADCMQAFHVPGDGKSLALKMYDQGL